MQNSIKLFEDNLVRSIWDEEKEEWYFSVSDVVQVLTDSTNVTDYIKKLRKRDEELSQGWGQIVTPLVVQTAGGKQKANFANVKGILRIIQSIPSKKAEPFKQWLAHVGAERLDQIQDPELSIKQALADYKNLGYSDNWINQRLKSIEIRKDLTDQWEQHNVQQGIQYAALTDIIYQAWAGKTAKEYKQFKNLKKENLRDNMTNEELVLNMLAELSATSITKAKNPKTLEENAQCAQEGGNVAAVARRELESKTGRNVVTSLNAKEFFAAQIEAKKEALYLPVRNFILGTDLHFAFSKEKVRVPYNESYFLIDQLYFHIDSKRNVLLKITHNAMTKKEKETFLAHIDFYNAKYNRNEENDAVGLVFTLSANMTKFEYVIPKHLSQDSALLNLPSADEIKEKLNSNLDELKMDRLLIEEQMRKEGEV